MKIKIIDTNKEYELFENCDFCDNRFAKYDEQFKDKLCDICYILNNNINIIEYLNRKEDINIQNKNL